MRWLCPRTSGKTHFPELVLKRNVTRLCGAIWRIVVLVCGVATVGEAQRSVGVIVSNAAIGSLIEGVRAHMAKRPLGRAVVLGGVGGLVSGSGRHLVNERTHASWWSARLISATGSALAELAVSDTFAVRFSMGPVDLAVVPRPRLRVRARLNAASTFFTIRALARPRSRILLRESLETGAITIVGPSDEQRATAQPGLIHLPINGYLRTPDGARRQQLDVAHELVHVMQFDVLQQSVGTALERRLARTTQVTRRIDRWLALGVTGPAIFGVTALAFPYRYNPFEIEAWSAANGSAPPRSP